VSKPTLVLTFVFSARPQRVFDVFTQPEHLNRWFTTAAQVDLQVGGQFSNGDGEHGTFIKVAVPRQLVFTYSRTGLGVETEVDVSFTPNRPLNRTMVRLVQKGLDPEKVTPEARDWLVQRWNFMGASLKRYLARQSRLSFDKWRSKRRPVSGFS
jgi:uncharacterized protein YndB with AHSA1/START domain